MSADIEVRNVFNVKVRGAVAIGYLRHGTVRVGQQTRPLALGLVFRERPSLDELRSALTPGTMLQFEDAPGTGDGSLQPADTAVGNPSRTHCRLRSRATEGIVAEAGGAKVLVVTTAAGRRVRPPGPSRAGMGGAPIGRFRPGALRRTVRRIVLPAGCT